MAAVIGDSVFAFITVNTPVMIGVPIMINVCWEVMTYASAAVGMAAEFLRLSRRNVAISPASLLTLVPSSRTIRGQVVVAIMVAEFIVVTVTVFVFAFVFAMITIFVAMVVAIMMFGAIVGVEEVAMTLALGKSMGPSQRHCEHQRNAQAFA